MYVLYMLLICYYMFTLNYICMYYIYKCIKWICVYIACIQMYIKSLQCWFINMYRLIKIDHNDHNDHNLLNSSMYHIVTHHHDNDNLILGSTFHGISPHPMAYVQHMFTTSNWGHRTAGTGSPFITSSSSKTCQPLAPVGSSSWPKNGASAEVIAQKAPGKRIEAIPGPGPF